jgi:predicted nucleic acid-binding protein
LPDKPEPIFLDTAYVYALVNTRDEWHQEAVKWQQQLEKERRRILTTELVLVEIADGLASISFALMLCR